MRPLLRVALAAVATLLVCAGLGAGGIAWLQADAEAARDARIAALDVALVDVRARDSLTAADACAIAEHHALTRPVDRALATTCHTPTFEPRGPGAGRLTGFVYGRRLDNALAGGGFATPLCLARSAAGWEVVGDDFRIPDCVISVPEGAPDAATITRTAIGDAAARKRAVALATIEAVRSALALGPPAPAVCAGLPEPTGGSVTTLPDATLAGRIATGTARHFGYGMAGCVVPEAEAPDPAVPSLGPGPCALAERPTHVLVLDAIAEDLPASAGADTFTGGSFRATLRLVELGAVEAGAVDARAVGAGGGRVLCERPVAFALPDSVLTLRSGTITTEYDRGVKRALCAEVTMLGGGRVRLDPWWGCGD